MRKLFIFIGLLTSTLFIYAQRFEDDFEDNQQKAEETNKLYDENMQALALRLDYTFAGNATYSNIYVDELVSLPRWYGKRQHLNEVPLTGNGQIIMRRHNSETVIFRHSFSTLFQEWLATEEAKRTQK